MTLTEPGRSRLLIVVGVLLCALGTWLQILADDTRQTWAMLFKLGWLAAILLVAGLNVALALGVLVTKRPARFDVARQRFISPGLLSTGVTGVMMLLFLSNFLADAISEWRNPTGRLLVIFLTAMAAVMVPIVLLYLILAWRGLRLELSPAGLTWQSPIFQRTIPWQALAAGGPPPPPPAVKYLELMVLQPELVTQRGWAVGGGSKERPTIPMQLNTHPSFLAGAIRWYAEHPEHREAIGTREEHDRLTAALVGG